MESPVLVVHKKMRSYLPVFRDALFSHPSQQMTKGLLSIKLRPKMESPVLVVHKKMRSYLPVFRDALFSHPSQQMAKGFQVCRMTCLLRSTIKVY